MLMGLGDRAVVATTSEDKLNTSITRLACTLGFWFSNIYTCMAGVHCSEETPTDLNVTGLTGTCN